MSLQNHSLFADIEPISLNIYLFTSYSPSYFPFFFILSTLYFFPILKIHMSVLNCNLFPFVLFFLPFHLSLISSLAYFTVFSYKINVLFLYTKVYLSLLIYNLFLFT